MNGEGTDLAPDLVGTRLSGDEIAKFLEKPSADASDKGMPGMTQRARTLNRWSLTCSA